MSMTARCAALLWVAAIGCYSDRPQQSTLPDGEFAGGGAGASTVSPGIQPGDPRAEPMQPGYASGPPGGGMDPASAYAREAGDDEDNVTGSAGGGVGGDFAVGPPSSGPAVIQPREPMPQLPEAGPDGASVDDNGEQIASADPQGNGTADVSDAEIDQTLGGYGQWIDTDDYGEVWRPDATVVGMDFTPYESGGSWQDTDAGWSFAADYGWGWLPFHYGRWAWFHDYWGWVPGHRWGSAWVDWRHGNGVVGWRPRPPGNGYHHNGYQYGGGTVVRDHRHPVQHDSNWRFATTRDFARPHVRSHLYGNPAEALRSTSRVSALPLRARTTVRAGDLMRSRYSSNNRAVVRDHRDAGRDAYGRGGYDRPSGGDAPAARGYPPAAPRSYPSSSGISTSRPGAPSSSSPNVGGYYAPSRGYNSSSGRGAAPRQQTFGGSGSSVVRDHRGSSMPARSGGFTPTPPAAPAAPPSHSSGGSSGGGGSHSSSGGSHSGGGGSSHSGGGHH